MTAGALILFGKRPQDFFSHAVVSVTEAGKRREIYEGNLISQYRELLEKIENPEVNPLLKVKKRRQHDERRAYPPRVLVELLVNMLVHRDYEIAEPARIEIHSGIEIIFANPGALTQKVASSVTLENDGRFTPLESITDQRNPSLCDIFFGISAMEREGTGLIDVGHLMVERGGASASLKQLCLPAETFSGAKRRAVRFADSRAGRAGTQDRQLDGICRRWIEIAAALRP